MILEVDVGNTRIKWRLLNEAARFRDSGFSHFDDLTAIHESLHEDQVTSIYISSVASDDINEQLTKQFKENFSVDPVFATVQSQACGLTCAYARPEDLGVDRWLAMLAAWRSEQRCSDRKSICVVDCGTAVTIDFVTQDGKHQGGYILPGLEMIAASLLGSTASISTGYRSGATKASLKPGQSTAEAVDHGRVLMLCSAVERAVSEYVDQPVNVYLTGGDAAVLLDYLPPLLNAVLWPDLVLEGLGVLFAYRD